MPISKNSNLNWCYSNANTIFVGEKPNSVSFSGCGFLGMYHIGVASCLKTHAPNWVKNIDRIYGCSVGSLVGALLLSDACMGEACQRMMNIVKDLRSRYLGPFSPRFRLNETLLRDIQDGLPEDAHIHASGKLYISLTRFPDGQNVIISKYKTRDELIQALLCSCFVPFYSGVFPSDICPRNDGAESLVDLSVVNTSIQMNASNLYRVSTMFYPPKPEVLREFCCQGYRETVQYLREHALFETTHFLRKSMSFSSLLHKVEERRKMTRRMSFSAQRMHEIDNKRLNSDDTSFRWDKLEIPTSEPLEECCVEDDIDFKNDDKLMTHNTASQEHRNVFIVVQVYPALVENRTIHLQFQLPPVILDALDASLKGKNSSWKRPMTKILTKCRRSVVVQVPLEKSYSIAVFLLRQSASLPNDAVFLTKRLQLLIDRFRQQFQHTGQKLIVKISNATSKARKNTVNLLQQIIVLVQIIVKALPQKSLPFQTALLVLLSAAKNSSNLRNCRNSDVQIV